MKILPKTDTAVMKDAAKKPPLASKVCMHVLEVVRTDYRVMREATALVEAGFEVSIVDIENDKARPAEEEINGVRVKHIIRPQWFISTRFKSWFLVKLGHMILLSSYRLLHTPADIYHAHDANALPACFIAACLRRKPLIFD